MHQINTEDLLDHSLHTNELLSVAPWIKVPLNIRVFKKITQKIYTTC